MSLSTVSRALAVSGFVGLLAACSGAATNSPVATLPSQSIAQAAAQSLSRSELLAKTLLVRPDIRAVLRHGRAHSAAPGTSCYKGLLFASDVGTDQVYRVKLPSGKLEAVGSGWSEPQGMAVDSKGNVYVADTANSRIVELNKKGAQVAVLSDPGERPVGVAVSPDGTVGVSNILSSSGGAGSVSIYAPGRTSPTTTASGFLSEDYFVGADAQDDFYVDGFDASTGAVAVGVITPGSTTIENTNIVTNIGFPGGVQVIATGKKKKAVQALLVGDQETGTMSPFTLPDYTPGSPVTFTGGSDPVEFAFDKPQTLIAAADAGLGQVDFWAWPAGGPIVCTYGGTFSEPIGVGLDPTGEE